MLLQRISQHAGTKKKSLKAFYTYEREEWSNWPNLACQNIHYSSFSCYRTAIWISKWIVRYWSRQSWHLLYLWHSNLWFVDLWTDKVHHNSCACSSAPQYNLKSKTSGTSVSVYRYVWLQTFWNWCLKYGKKFYTFLHSNEDTFFSGKKKSIIQGNFLKAFTWNRTWVAE